MGTVWYTAGMLPILCCVLVMCMFLLCIWYVVFHSNCKYSLLDTMVVYIILLSWYFIEFSFEMFYGLTDLS